MLSVTYANHGDTETTEKRTEILFWIKNPKSLGASPVTSVAPWLAYVVART